MRIWKDKGGRKVGEVMGRWKGKGGGERLENCKYFKKINVKNNYKKIEKKKDNDVDVDMNWRVAVWDCNRGTQRVAIWNCNHRT